MWWKTWETVMLQGKNTCGKGQLGYANVKSCAKLLWLALKILQKDFMCANHRFKRRWAGKKSERPVHVRHFKWIWQQLGAKRAANCLAVSQQCQKGKCGSKREKKTSSNLLFQSASSPQVTSLRAEYHQEPASLLPELFTLAAGINYVYWIHFFHWHLWDVYLHEALSALVIRDVCVSDYIKVFLLAWGWRLEPGWTWYLRCIITNCQFWIVKGGLNGGLGADETDSEGDNWRHEFS